VDNDGGGAAREKKRLDGKDGLKFTEEERSQILAFNESLYSDKQTKQESEAYSIRL